MDNIEIGSNKNEQNMKIPYINNMLEYKWFFDSFNQAKRKEIFEIIFNYLFKDTNSEDIKDSPKQIKDYIKEKDYRYYNKTFKEIILSFKEKELELNESLKRFRIRLFIQNRYSLILEDYDFLEIRCLRNIRFEEKYEWIWSPLYLLYFQFYILNYKKPSRVENIALKEEEEDKKVETIDSVSKAEQILLNENFIYIEDSGNQIIDYKDIFAEGNKQFIFSKNNVFEFLDYNINDSKQIKDSDNILDNNYNKLLDFSFEPHFDNLIYSFHNEYYFFESNLITCLNTCIKRKLQFFYINFNKINKIFNEKYKFKKYLSFWLAKLFPNQEEINNESKFCDFVKELIDLIMKKKDNYLEIILNELNEEISKTNKNYDKIENTITSKRILIILNNINLSNLQFIEKKRFLNLNILFIINIQDNFDIFQTFFYEQTKLKKFFLENENEIAFKDSNNEKNNENNDYNYYSAFISKDEYENSANELIEKIFKDFKTNTDKLLNLAFILNTSEFINRLNNKKNSIIELKINLGFSELLILKPFCPLINFCVSVKNNINFYLDNIKFKEIFIYNKLKELYLSCMITYLNQNSTELFLDDIKGPLLEKDIILSILTGQINTEKYSNHYKFQEVKVKSIFCLNKDKLKDYEDNTKKNIVITQESKTAEFYDFAFKINNNMKFVQISIFKDRNDLEKLSKEAIILDLINFDLNKEKLNLGQVDNYSFAIITSINVYKQYSSLEQDDKIKHTFFLMKEHCKKNDLEFYIYNYFENQIYIYNEINDNIEKFDNFFDIGKKINFFDKGLQIYNFIEASNKKISIKLTKSDLLKPFEKYYQSNGEKKLVLWI